MDPKIQKIQRGASGEYTVPATIVNTLIAAILTGLLGIAGYMILWAKTDAEFKIGVITKLVEIERRIGTIEARVDNGVLPLAKQRIDDHERRLDRLENR